MKSIGKFLTGFFLGGIVGALAVLLFTPEPGDSEELKKELARLQKKTE